MSRCIAKKQNLIRVGKKYRPAEVLSEFREEYARRSDIVRIDFDGHGIKMGSHRYWTFAKKGLRCATCGIKGQYFRKEKHYSTEGEKYHFNLYAIDDVGDEVLITKDHVVPRSKGGSNHISNYQTMCKVCNERKGAGP